MPNIRCCDQPYLYTDNIQIVVDATNTPYLQSEHLNYRAAYCEGS